MRRDPQKRLNFDKLVWFPILIIQRRAFSSFTEEQIRMKLKEFAQYWKKGENTGWWKLKNNFTLPNEEDIRKVVAPEQACIVESMLVGQQRLKDCG